MAVNSDGGGGDVKAEVDNGTNEGELLEEKQCKSSVDGPCVFSESIVWKIQRDFYETHGVQCWQQVCMKLRELFTLC